MEEKILLAELTKNCGEKKAKVLELFEALELAELGYKLQDERCKDIHNRVLAEHEFLCDKEFARDTGFNVGDRITDDEFLFLLSDEDFDRVMKLSRPIEVAEKITDEDGYFLENWGKIRCDARCELVEYIILEIVPEALRPIFWENRINYTFQEKLIKITKDAFFKKAA